MTGEDQVKTIKITLPDEQAAALDRAVADGDFASRAELVLAAIEDFLTMPLAYDPDALARDIAEHRAEKARGEPGYPPEAARTWLGTRRPA
jgi:Arc/MetJ-type ribon-helix-helix transcriptional regulator